MLYSKGALRLHRLDISGLLCILQAQIIGPSLRHCAQQAQPESAGLSASSAGLLCSPDTAPEPQRASLDDAATTCVPSPPSQVGTLHKGVTPRGSTPSTVVAVSCHPPYPDGTTGASGPTSGRVAPTTGTSSCVSAESSASPPGHLRLCLQGPPGHLRLCLQGPPGHLRLCLQGRPGLRGLCLQGPPGSWGLGLWGPHAHQWNLPVPASRLKLSLQGPPSGLKLSMGPTRSSEAFSAGPNLSAGDPLAQGALPTDTTFKVSAPQIGDDASQVIPPSDPAHGGLLGPLTLPVTLPYLLSTRLGDPRSVLQTRPGGGWHSQPASLHGSLC
ncbi:hypothetical protein ACOMHN_033237 [Nucella lapillus]